MARRRMVYVRDEDAPLWERAEELAGGEESASAVVAEALRRWVAVKEAEANGFGRVELEVDGRTVAFQGRLLARRAEGAGVGGVVGLHWTVYETARGQILVHTLRSLLSSTARYRVFPTFDEAKQWAGDGQMPRLPQALVDAAAAVLGDDGVVELDI